MCFSVPKCSISSCIHVVLPIREIEKTSIVGFFCLIHITILGWGLWFTYWGLYDRLSQGQRGLSDADARNKGNLLAWSGLLLGSVDIGEPMAWGRGWSWAREGDRMSLELPRKGKEYMLEKKAVSGVSESRLESRASWKHLLPHLLRALQKENWPGTRGYYLQTKCWNGGAWTGRGKKGQ